MNYAQVTKAIKTAKAEIDKIKQKLAMPALYDSIMLDQQRQTLVELEAEYATLTALRDKITLAETEKAERKRKLQEERDKQAEKRLKAQDAKIELQSATTELALAAKKGKLELLARKTKLQEALTEHREKKLKEKEAEAAREELSVVGTTTIEHELAEAERLGDTEKAAELRAVIADYEINFGPNWRDAFPKGPPEQQEQDQLPEQIADFAAMFN